MRLIERVVGCDGCGFAGLVGPRHREWLPYQAASSQSHSVAFSVCTACGVTHADAAGRLSRQPASLRVAAGEVALTPWVPADPPAGSEAGDGCPACGAASSLLRSVAEPAALRGVRCPVCWAGPLRITDARAVHPRW